ncbi:MAG TPA: MFS transporter [Candidatus Binataceae bacterium]|nr:MFS transporter [Candidatus Binataceae bacterium]
MREQAQIDNSRAPGFQAASPSLYRHADFMKLWAGETISLFGTRIGSVAMSFAAVISLRATPLQMGLLSAAGYLPSVGFSLVTGAWVDRLRRRPIMILADLGRTAVLATVPLAAIYGVLTMRHLYAVMLLAALLDLFFDISYRTYLPTLVDREQLLDANGKLTASSSLAEVAGFSICGWLVQWITAPFAILIDAVSFLASALAIAIISTPEPIPSGHRGERALVREIAAGAKTIWSDGRLRALGLVALVGGFFPSLWNALYMLLVVDALGFKPAALGMIFAAGGASALLGALAAQRTSQWLGTGRAMVLGLAAGGFAMVLPPLARGAGASSVALLVAHQLLGDGALTIYFINSVTLVQTITPHTILGRVNASLRFLNHSSILIGLVVGGVAGQFVGLRPTMLVGAAGVWLAAALLAASPIGNAAAVGVRIENGEVAQQ